MEVSHSDGELVARLLRDDQWAKEALYRRYFPAVWGLACRLVGSSVDAEDVVQDAFAVALQDIRALKAPDRFKAWLLQITVHQAHRRFRRRRMLRTLGIRWGVEDCTLESQALPDSTQEVRVQLAEIDRVLARLPAGDRTAWMLRYVEGYSLPDVADACRCSLATAKRRIARAHRQVQAEICIEELTDD